MALKPFLAGLAVLVLGGAPAMAGQLIAIQNGNAIATFDAATLAPGAVAAAPGVVSLAYGNAYSYVNSGQTIARYDQDGNYTGAIMTSAGRFTRLYDDGSSLYAVFNDGSYNAVERFQDADLAFLTSFAIPAPASLTVGPDTIYVASGNLVQFYDLDGNQGGSVGISLGSFTDVAYGGSTLFAAYELWGQRYVLSLDSSSQLLDSFGIGAATSLAYGDGSLYAAYGDTVSHFDLHGTLLGSVTVPGASFGGLAFDPLHDVTPVDVPQPAGWTTLLLGLAVLGLSRIGVARPPRATRARCMQG